MLAGPILEEHEVPAPPVGPDHRQEHLMRLIDPLLGDQQGQIAAGDIDRPVEDPLGVVARDRHPHLLTDRAVAAIQRRRFGDILYAAKSGTSPNIWNSWVSRVSISPLCTVDNPSRH